MTHSPGPWKVGYRASDVMAESHIPGKGPMKVCDIRGWGYLTGKGMGALGLPDDEAITIQEANAHLIAAAPDLLEALRGVVRVADRKTDEFDAARSAIAKAEGRALLD